MHRLLALVAALALLAACATPRTPPTQTAALTGAPAPASFDAAAADRLVAEQRWSELLKLHTDVRAGEDMRRSLDWSRDHLMNGGTVFIGLPYAVNLWRVATAAPPGSKLGELKDTGATVALYGFAVILIDGQRCGDSTSPGERASEWLASFREPLRYAAALPRGARDKIVDAALHLETGIAARRDHDPWLCGAGMKRLGAAMQAMAQSGEQPREVPTPLGGVGKTFVLPDPPGWTPTFISKEDAAPKEEAARRNLPTVLNGLLDRVAAAQPG